MKHCLICFIAIVLTTAYTKNTCLAQTQNSLDTKSLAGEWKLLPVLASDAASGKLPVLQFNVESHKFLGNTGCNSMEGKFELNGNILSFSEQAILTKNNCQGYNEEAFISNLIKVNHYRIEKGVLELMVDGAVLSKWVRTEPTNGVKQS